MGSLSRSFVVLLSAAPELVNGHGANYHEAYYYLLHKVIGALHGEAHR